MQGKSIAIGLAAALVATAAQAQTELVVVSWGGAYSASQQKAYHDPYMAANADIEILNDDSASEGSRSSAPWPRRTTSPGISST